MTHRVRSTRLWAATVTTASGDAMVYESPLDTVTICKSLRLIGVASPDTVVSVYILPLDEVDLDFAAWIWEAVSLRDRSVLSDQTWIVMDPGDQMHVTIIGPPGTGVRTTGSGAQLVD